jgi:hypothetical protein
MDDLQKWHVAWARFDALRRAPPFRWDEDAVQHYHEIVTSLEEASPSDDLSSFRVPDSELQRKIISSRLGIHTFSEKRYCDNQYMLRQIEGIAIYFQDRQLPTEPRKFGF